MVVLATNDGGPLPANEDFFRERRAQAVLKHGILSRYPNVFASKAGRGYDRVVFLDGYAGPGKYDDGTPGSPLLFARAADKVSGFRNVVGIYVEEDSDEFQMLKGVLGGRTGDHLFQGDLSSHLSEIATISRGSPLFAFLDPFGTALDHNLLQSRLLKRPDRAPVEVLLHISVSTVARLGGLFRRRKTDGIALTAADEKSLAHLTRFVGGDWWQEFFAPVRDSEDVGRATEAALGVAREYQRIVCEQSGFLSVSLPIRQRPGLLPRYVLVLFTRHVDGLWYFADSLGQAGRDWQGAWRSEADAAQVKKMKAKNVQDGLFPIEDFFPETAFDPVRYEADNKVEWVNAISSNLLRILSVDGPFVLARRVADVYGESLGAANEPHVRRAIKQLHAAGLIRNTGVGRYFYRETITPGA